MPKVQAAKLVFDPKGQDRDSVIKALDHVLKRGGCPACGRLSILKIDFIEKPPVSLKAVTSGVVYGK